MPNWASVTYKCVGDTKEVRSLYEMMERMEKRKDPVHPNGFGTLWLGELVQELGYDWESVDCRGDITAFFYDERGILTIMQETAWCEQVGVREAISHRFPSIKVYFQEEEDGLELYSTNDRDGTYFPERFKIEGDNVCEYFMSLEEAVSFLGETYGIEVAEKSVDGVVKAIGDYTANLDDCWLSFHEFEYECTE